MNKHHNKSKVPQQGEQSNNNIIVSHTSDLDGRISRELYVFYTGIPANTPTVWVEYGDLIAKAQSTIAEWAMGKDVVILDFSMTQQFVDEVARVAKSVKLFDHHTGTTELIAPGVTTIVVDTKESTVSLLQKHFTGQETVFTNICREIDLNMIENPNILGYKLYLDDVFFSKDRNLQEDIEDFQVACFLPERYEDKKQEQLKLAKELASRATIDKVERTSSILRADEHKGIDTDIIAHFMLKNKKIDFAVISFDKVDKGIRISSVRKLKSCTRSLEEYCQARGGGGRETAGAFREKVVGDDDNFLATPTECKNESL